MATHQVILGEMNYSVTLAELAEASHIEFTGHFTSESVLIHRLVGPQRFARQFSFVDEDSHPGYYYVRVRQSNGQMAWSSPIYVGATAAQRQHNDSSTAA